MFGFLEQTGGIQFRVGTPSVSGDYATVPVTLHSPIPSQDLNAFQHLFWYNGQWRIADANGGLTHTK
jgi:predicted secreted protein